MKLNASMSESHYFPSNWEFANLDTFHVIFETRTLFGNLTAKIDWRIHARWLPLAHVFERRSAFGGAVISLRRERWITASQMLIECCTKRSYFDQADEEKQ